MSRNLCVNAQEKNIFITFNFIVVRIAHIKIVLGLFSCTLVNIHSEKKDVIKYKIFYVLQIISKNIYFLKLLPHERL